MNAALHSIALSDSTDEDYLWSLLPDSVQEKDFDILNYIILELDPYTICNSGCAQIDMHIATLALHHLGFSTSLSSPKDLIESESM